MNSEPLNTIPQRISALGSLLPLGLAAPDRVRVGPGRPRKYERGVWLGPAALVLAESEIGLVIFPLLGRYRIPARPSCCTIVGAAFTGSSGVCCAAQDLQ